jgi:hypothetical protein
MAQASSLLNAAAAPCATLRAKVPKPRPAGEGERHFVKEEGDGLLRPDAEVGAWHRGRVRFLLPE